MYFEVSRCEYTVRPTEFVSKISCFPFRPRLLPNILLLCLLFWYIYWIYRSLWDADACAFLNKIDLCRNIVQDDQIIDTYDISLLISSINIKSYVSYIHTVYSTYFILPLCETTYEKTMGLVLIYVSSHSMEVNELVRPSLTKIVKFSVDFWWV